MTVPNEVSSRSAECGPTTAAQHQPQPSPQPPSIPHIADTLDSTNFSKEHNMAEFLLPFIGLITLVGGGLGAAALLALARSSRY